MPSFRGQSLIFWIKYTLKLLIMWSAFIFVEVLTLFMKKSIKKDTIRNILILFLPPLGIGDLIMISPFICALKKKFLKCEINVLTHLPSLFEDFKFIKFEGYFHALRVVKKNDLIISPTLSLRHVLFFPFCKFSLGYFTHCISQSNFIRSRTRYDPKRDHYLSRSLRLLNLLRINVKEKTYPKIRFIFPKVILPSKYMIVCPFGKLKEKSWPIDKYIELINTLINEFRIPIVLIGSKENREVSFNESIVREIRRKDFIINLTGKVDFQKLACIIKESLCYIGNDSGPSHLSFLLAPKSFVIFGAVDHLSVLPTSGRDRINVYFSKLCKYRPCYNGFIKPACKKGFACLKGIKIERVVSDVKKLIGSDDEELLSNTLH
jgi:ADP-heptose:LPS heptosyltransferase